MFSSSAYKLGSRAAGNIPLNRENREKKFSPISFGHSVFFLHKNINTRMPDGVKMTPSGSLLVHIF